MIILFDGMVDQDYHQIYLCDAGMRGLPDDYSDEAIARRVSAGEEALVIHVERELGVPVRVTLHDAPPDIDLDTFDHAVRTAISVPSGSVVLAGLLAYAPDAPHLDLPAGRYGVLVTFTALGSLRADDFEGDDHYAIDLWPDPEADGDVVVLKAWVR